MMLERISEHIWIMPKDDETDRPVLGYVAGTKTALLIDAGNSPDHISYFYGAVRSMGMPDPSFIALTHWHWDHVFGLSGSPAKSIASVATNERLVLMHRWDWTDSALSSRIAAGLEIQWSADMIRRAMPIRQSFKIKSADITFEDHCGLRIDNIECQMLHVGGPHSDDSTVVYIPSEDVLFLGDCYAEDIYMHNSIRLRELSPLLRRLEKIDAKWFIPSHGEPMEKGVFLEEMGKVEKIGKLVGKITNDGALAAALEKGLGRPATEDELTTGKFFVAGNRLKPGEKKRFIDEKKANMHRGSDSRIDDILSEGFM